MTQDELAKLSFAELRDRLKARTDEFDKTNDIDLPEALGYLTTLPENAHTPDSVDALIQLARIFFFAAQPVEALQAASVASRLASALDQGLLLCNAKGVEGLALSDLGRFTEATVAHAESLRLARLIGNIELEGWAIKRVGDLWAAMGQLDVAIVYLSRSRELGNRTRATGSRACFAQQPCELRNSPERSRSRVAAHYYRFQPKCPQRDSTRSGGRTLTTPSGICTF